MRTGPKANSPHLLRNTAIFPHPRSIYSLKSLCKCLLSCVHRLVTSPPVRRSFSVPQPGAFRNSPSHSPRVAKRAPSAQCKVYFHPKRRRPSHVAVDLSVSAETNGLQIPERDAKTFCKLLRVSKASKLLCESVPFKFERCINEINFREVSLSF